MTDMTPEDILQGLYDETLVGNAPVVGPMGAAIAALSISGPSARLTTDRIAQLAPLLIEEAHTLAVRLGHRDHTRGPA